MFLPRLFWDKVDATGDCWEWTARHNRNGYAEWSGTKRWRQRYPEASRLAHRLIWVALVGDPGTLDLDHLCRNPGCVNPDHLEPVTRSVNLQRGERVGRPRRTHCRAGHSISGDNLYVKPSGERCCRLCRRKAGRLQARKRAAGLTVSDQPLLTECKRGHRYDEANTYVDPQGRRHCKGCRRLASRRLYRRTSS